MKPKYYFNPCNKTLYVDGKIAIQSISWDDGIIFMRPSVTKRQDFLRMKKKYNQGS